MDDKPKLNSDGVAGWTNRYDAFSHVIEWINFGVNGEPIASERGAARGVDRYDRQGRLVDRQWFDAENHRLEPRITVAGVLPGSAGERIGIKKGDIFLKYDTVELSDADSFLRMRRQEKSHPGKPLMIERGETTLTVTAPPGLLHVTLSDRFQPVAESAGQPPAKSETANKLPLTTSSHEGTVKP